MQISYVQKNQNYSLNNVNRLSHYVSLSVFGKRAANLFVHNISSFRGYRKIILGVIRKYKVLKLH